MTFLIILDSEPYYDDTLSGVAYQKNKFSVKKRKKDIEENISSRLFFNNQKNRI